MAIVNAVIVGRSRGSVGNVTLRVAGGETIMSQKVTKGGRIGTYNQVLRRVRWANLVAAYRALNAEGNGNAMSQSFPARPARVSNFNMFMKANLAVPSVAAVSLAKSDVGADFVAPAPFIVSRGTLSAPSYHPTLGADGSIPVPNLASTTVGALSRWLISRFGVSDGDTLTFVDMNWPEGGVTAGAGVKFITSQIVINTSSNESIEQFDWIEVGPSAGGAPPTVKMLIGNSVGGNAYVTIVGRPSAEGYLVSSSQFAEADLAGSGYNTYSSDNQRAIAVASYGFRLDPYLQQSVLPQ